jgi:hypothetical protein
MFAETFVDSLIVICSPAKEKSHTTLQQTQLSPHTHQNRLRFLEHLTFTTLHAIDDSVFPWMYTQWSALHYFHYASWSVVNIVDVFCRQVPQDLYDARKMELHIPIGTTPEPDVNNKILNCL